MSALRRAVSGVKRHEREPRAEGAVDVVASEAPADRLELRALLRELGARADDVAEKARRPRR